MADIPEDIHRQTLEINTRISRAKAYTKGWHDNIETWRKLYNNQHYVGQTKLSETEPQYSDPTYMNTVDLATGIFLANEMTWKAFGFSPSMTEQEVSSRAEKFLAGVLSVNNERNEYDIGYEVYMHFNRDGGAVLYSVYDPGLHKQRVTATVIENGEEKKISVISEPPVITRVIDPLSFHVLPGGPGRWQCACDTTRRFLSDVESEYADDLMKLYGKPTLPSFARLTETARQMQEGEFINYWELAKDKDGAVVVKNAVLFDSDIIRPLKVMKGYDSLPYTVNFFKPTSRSESGSWDSILSPLQTTIPWMEKNINRLQHQIDLYSSLPMIWKNTSGRKASFDPGMGNVVELSADDDFGFPTWPGNSPDFWKQLDYFRSRIQQSGFSDIMFGGGPSSVSGFALSQMGDQNRIRLEQPITHLEQLWSWWAKKVLHMAATFAKNTSISIYGILKGSTFHDYIKGGDLEGIHISCEIRPEFPNERVRKHAMATQAKGTLPESVLIQDYYGYQQPDDIRKMKLMELAQSHPIAIQYSLIAEMSERAKQGDAVAAMTLQSLINGGAGNPGGRPTEPNRPEQPMGIQSSTGQPLNNGQQDQGAAQVAEMAGTSPNLQGGVE
jgi:hypothetical protein